MIGTSEPDAILVWCLSGTPPCHAGHSRQRACVSLGKKTAGWRDDAYSVGEAQGDVTDSRSWMNE